MGSVGRRRGPLEKDHLTGIFSFKEEVWDREECRDRITQPPVIPRVPWTLVDRVGWEATWVMELIDGLNLSPGAHRNSI